MQAKRWITGTLSGEDLGTFSSAAVSILHKDARNGMVLYHAPGSRVCNDVMCNFDDVETMRVHELEPEIKQITAQPPVSKQESTFKPTSSQEKALEFLVGQKHGVSLLAMACSTGKTCILGWHAAAIGCSTVVIAAPLIASAEQGLRRLAAFLPGHKPVAFWSGSCSIDGISAFLDEDRLQQNLKAKSKVLIGTTYDSAGKVLAALKAKRRNGAGTLVLMDEAHNIGSADDNPARLLTLGGGKLRKTILATTTPPKSMMKELFDGQEIPTFSYSMREAISNGEIADYTITMPLVQDQNFRPVELAELEQGEDEWDAMGRAIFHAGAMHHDGVRRSIVYCYSIAQCKAYEDAFRQVCEKYLGVEFWIGRITCEQTAGQRAGLLKSFQKPTKKVRLHILTSIRVLDEALDVPRCDSVFFTDVSSRITEKSWLRAVQRLSRATRLDRDNLHKVARGYVWADLADNDNIANVLKTLQHNDPDVASKVRVHSSQYDIAVGNKDIQQLCHLELKEWQERFKLSRMNAKDFVDLKIQWLAQHCSDTRPSHSKQMYVDLPDGGSFLFRPGDFLGCIKGNWLNSAATNLTHQQKALIEEKCTWFEDTLQEWHRRSVNPRKLVDMKVRWLAEHCANVKPTVSTSMAVNSPYLCIFKPAQFVICIRENWVKNGRPSTRLDAEQKEFLEERCTWLLEATQQWQEFAAQKKPIKPTVNQQVRWLVEMCAESRPAQSVVLEVDEDDNRYFFKPGHFLVGIANNFTELKPRTKLTMEQKESLVENCPWFPAAIQGWQAAAQDTSYKPSIDERIDWMIQNCSDERPAQSKRYHVETADGKSYDFQPGNFLSKIANNFVIDDNIRPSTLLTQEQQVKLIEGCEWFPEAVEKWQALADDDSYKPTVQQKLEWLIEHCKEKRPVRRDQIDIALPVGHFTFKPEPFIHKAKNCFVEGAKIQTRLTSEQQNLMHEHLHKWLPNAIKAWQLAAHLDSS